MKDQRGRHCSLVDRSGQSNDISELAFDKFDVERPDNYRVERALSIGLA